MSDLFVDQAEDELQSENLVRIQDRLKLLESEVKKLQETINVLSDEITKLKTS